MRALIFSAVSLVRIVLCDIRGISEASIKYIREHYEMKCVICIQRLIGGPEEEEAECLAACPHAEQHVFHAECLAEMLVSRDDSSMRCPLCRKDWRAMARRLLLTCRDDDMAGSLRQRMLKHMDALASGDLKEVLEQMRFLPSDYECLAKVLEDSKFTHLRNFTVHAGVIFCNADSFKFLMTAEYDQDFSDEYDTALAKCIAGDVSASQVKDILLKVAEIADICYREVEVQIAVNIVLEAPHIKLPASDVHALIVHFLKNKIYGPVRTLLKFTDVLHTISTDDVFEILLHCSYLNGYTGLDAFEHVWLRAINLHKLDSQQIQAHKQSIEESFMVNNSEEKHAIIKKHLDAVFSRHDHEPLGIDGASDAIDGMPKENLKNLDLDGILKYLIEKGIMRTILNATQEERTQLFWKIRNSWGDSAFIEVYSRFPESATNIEMDLAILKYYMNSLVYCLSDFVKALVRKQYFGYEAFKKVLDLLLKARSTTETEKASIWLLLAAKHRGFLGEPNGEESKALIEKFVQAEFFWGVAFLIKSIDGSAEYGNIISQYFNRVLEPCFSLSCLLHEYIIYRRADSCIFTLWCKYSASFIGSMLLKNSMVLFEDNLCYLVMKAIFESECFANYATGKDIEELVEAWLMYKSDTFECISLFFTVVRSEPLTETAKKCIFKKFTKGRMLSENNAAAMNAAGFNFELTNAELRYKMEDGSVKVLSDGDAIDEPVATIIESMDRHRFLELIREIEFN